MGKRGKDGGEDGTDKERLRDLLQVQVDSLQLRQSSHYERDSA